MDPVFRRTNLEHWRFRVLSWQWHFHEMWQTLRWTLLLLLLAFTGALLSAHYWR